MAAPYFFKTASIWLNTQLVEGFVHAESSLASILYRTIRISAIMAHDFYYRSHYEEETDSTRIILLQCELAHENTELLDSVRYIIEHESSEANTQAHTVLLLNLPRGHKFTGYQG